MKQKKTHEKYQWNAYPQKLPSIFTMVMTLTLNFQV